MKHAIVMGAIFAGSVLTGLLIVAVNNPKSREVAEASRPVMLNETPLVAAPSSPPEAAASLDVSEIPPAIETQILRDAGDPGAKLRAVRMIDKKQQIGCGEIMRSNARKYARFVWLAVPAKVIAEENGGGAYAQVAPLCYGKGAAGI